MIVCRCSSDIIEPLPGSPNIWPCLACGRVGLVLSDGDTVMWLVTEDFIGLNDLKSDIRRAGRSSVLTVRMGDSLG